MDDLDKALTKHEAAPIEEAASAVLEMVRGLTPDSLDLTNAEIRAQSVEAYEVLANLASHLRAKSNVIRLSWLRHMVTTGDRKVMVPWQGRRATVAYEPPRNTWEVKGNDAGEMHKELAALIPEGLLSEEELELAVRPVVAYQTNHTKLGALARRSERMKAIIDAHRHLAEPDPMAGTVRFPES